MTVYRSQLTLEQWQAIDSRISAVRAAAKELDDHLMEILLKTPDKDTQLLLLRIMDDIDVFMPDCTPKSEWVGGESWRMREPSVVGGCSFPAYFDDDGKPIRH